MIELSVLEEIAEIFASLRDVDAALARFLELVRALSGSSFGAIYLRDEARGQYRRWAESGETPALHLPLALVDRLFEGLTHRALSLDDARFDGLEAVESSRALGFHAALAMPLRHGGALVGVLALGFPSLASIDESKVRTVAAVSRFPAAAIAQARTMEVGARRARLADALRRFGERALAMSEEEALHRLILDTTVELTGSDQASITHVTEGRLRVIAGVGKDAALVGSEAPTAALNEALDSDEPYVVSDVAAGDPGTLLNRLARKSGARSFMALAMRHQSRVFGHIFAGAAESHRYRAEEVEAMRILASMAAAVLEQRSAQAAARQQARRLAATIEHLPILIEVFGGSSGFFLANAAARAMRSKLGVPDGVPATAFGGLRVLDLDGHPVSPDELAEVQAARGHAVRREVVLARGDGECVATMQVAAAPIFAADGRDVESVVLGCQDVSRLHELARDKERFFRIAAHELRTPLTALHATTQLIETDPGAFEDRARRDPLLARIRRQSGRLVRLVEQLLDSVRVNSGAVPLARTAVDLVALCRDVAELMPTDGPRATVEAEGAVVGNVDPLRMEQVLTNLLTNAVRYGRPDGRVIVDVRREGARVLLSVRDDGIGIPAHQLEQLFTPFFRGSNAQKRNAGGLGLGLHIAQEIVRRHGGLIRVESRENVGSTFTVELPLDCEPVGS